MSETDIVRSVTDYIINEVASTVPANRPAPDFPLIEGGLLDSLGLFKLIAFMEDTFRISIVPEDIQFENFATVNAIETFIRKKRNA
jgi:acyl carrier protein